MDEAQALASFLRNRRTAAVSTKSMVADVSAKDASLLAKVADEMHIGISDVARLLIASFFTPENIHTEMSARLGRRWVGEDTEIITIDFLPVHKWWSYAGETFHNAWGATWATQMLNGALDWWRSTSPVNTTDEADVRARVCEYLREKGIPYHADIVSESELGWTKNIEKTLNKKGYPDLFIHRPHGKYHGLFLELKKDAPILDPDHIMAQMEYGKELQAEGYAWSMTCGYERAIQAIEKYFAEEGK